MAANTLRERRILIAKPHRFCIPDTIIGRAERRKLIHRYPLSSVSDDEEIKFVTRAATWMLVLAVAPLLLFYIVTFFYPDFFLITPNQAGTSR